MFLHALVVGVLTACLLLLWMQHFGKFWRYRYAYGLAGSFVLGAAIFAVATGLQGVYEGAVHAAMPLFSLACWRYMSYISKGIQTPHSTSAGVTTTLLPRISPISAGFGVAFGFLFAFGRFSGSIIFSPWELVLLACGCVLGAIAYAVAVRLSMSYLQTGQAYRIAVIALIVVCLGYLFVLDNLLLCMVGLVGVFSWTGMALLVSLTAAIVRNPRKQIYLTSCCGLLWLPLGLLVGSLTALALEGPFAVAAVDFPMMAAVYVVLLAIVILFPALPGNLAPDYEEVIEQGGFMSCCNSVAREYALSARETEVMILLARGKTAKRIAEELVVSPATVHTHVAHIYRKMGINSKEELLDAIETRRK